MVGEELISRYEEVVHEMMMVERKMETVTARGFGDVGGGENGSGGDGS